MIHNIENGMEMSFLRKKTEEGHSTFAQDT